MVYVFVMKIKLNKINNSEIFLTSDGVKYIEKLKQMCYKENFTCFYLYFIFFIYSSLK